MTPELSLLFVNNPTMGYGRLGVRLAEEIRELGVDLYDGLDIPNPTSSERLLAEAGSRRYKKTNAVCWVSVPTHARGWYEGQHPSIFTMWEATNLPESFRENLHEFETVIVPSEHNLELFSRFHDNVKFVPLGVDPIKWQYRERTPPGRFFNYLIGGSGPRKGTDLARKAFLKLWGKEGSWGEGPIPRLIMKSPKGEADPACRDRDRIDVVAGRISEQAEIDLYADAHVYLQPSRGEGFGLQPLQAIAQGCPTILTAAHGHGSFAHLGMPLGSTMVPADYFIYGDAGDWWEPDLDELCDWMLWTYENYDQAVKEAAANSDLALRDFTWGRCAARFLDTFDGQLTAPYQGDGSWRETDLKLYLIRVTRRWQPDIGGTSRLFEPGRDYYEPADVKRIAFEMGDLLDLSCVEKYALGTESGAFDSGLTEEQLARVPHYRAHQAYCPHCTQRLNSGRTKAQDIEDGTFPTGAG